jgi:hypothetical protein
MRAAEVTSHLAVLLALYLSLLRNISEPLSVCALISRS